MIEVRDQDTNFLDGLLNDYHVPIVFKTSTEKYNIVKFSVHKSMDEHLGWTEKMRRKYFRAQKSNYLSQNSVIFINGEKIWNHIIDKKLESISEKE